MSQIDRVVNDVFTITCGDGKIFEDFIWNHKGGSIPINGKVYEYPDKQGSKVDRRLFKSPIYDIEFWVNGDDTNAIFSEFIASAANLNSWQIEHPVYGLLDGHPVTAIKYTPSGTINGLLVTFRFITSDIQEAVGSRENTLQKIETLILESRETNQELYAATTPVQISDRSLAIESINKQNLFFEGVASLNNALDTLENLVDDALAYADTIVEYPATALESIQAVLALPGILTTKIETKLTVYQDTIEALAEIFYNR